MATTVNVSSTTKFKVSLFTLTLVSIRRTSNVIVWLTSSIFAVTLPVPTSIGTNFIVSLKWAILLSTLPPVEVIVKLTFGNKLLSTDSPSLDININSTSNEPITLSAVAFKYNQLFKSIPTISVGVIL